MANFGPTIANISGPTSATTGAATIGGPVLEELDVSIMVVVTANNPIVLTTAAGFAEMTNSPQSTGTAGQPPAVRLGVYWRRETSANNTNPVVAANGDFIYGNIFTVRGAKRTGNPIDASAGGILASASTAFSVPGATTTVPLCLVCAIVAHSTDIATAEASGWANADLVNFTEPSGADGSTISGSGGGFAFATGIKTAAGVYGASTGSLVTSSVQALFSFAIAPQVSTFDGSVIGAGGGTTISPRIIFPGDL